MEDYEPAEGETSRIGLTLETYILEGMLGRPEARGFFTSLLNQIGLAAKMVTARVRRAGLSNVLGTTGDRNATGDVVQKLDQEAHDTLLRVLGRRNHCAAAASEEEEDIRVLSTADSASYLVVFDPLDGSSNIDVNISIGTIFGVYRKDHDGPATREDFLKPGSELQAAGYVIYGSSTQFVITTGGAVHGFTYDPSVGEFLLSHENIRVPEHHPTYSINEGNAARWTEGVRRWNDWVKEEDRATGRPYSMRYVGTLVADAHRTLLRGGVFAYPADRKSPDGKLRLLYEANPFAFIFEAAGGVATTGTQRVLDLQPSELHQKVPLILGSKRNVAEYLELTRGD
ncbi:MAG: class 1 fructose-bisphosphatase [Deltaproteobacteria bacterium]|nr:class 1 fructose-bisphosphatase [Deltaproteobacteria bacterium]